MVGWSLIYFILPPSLNVVKNVKAFYCVFKKYANYRKLVECWVRFSLGRIFQNSRKTETRKVEIDKRHEKIAAGADQKPISYLFNFRGLRVSKLAQK